MFASLGSRRSWLLRLRWESLGGRRNNPGRRQVSTAPRGRWRPLVRGVVTLSVQEARGGAVANANTC
ncbi:hypothetical protein [Corynebacterium matruchotii]